MKYLIGLLLAVAVIQGGSARILDKCQLAHELLRQGFPRNQLENWVCLVISESSGDTGAMNTVNTDGSYDWGLFQINDRYWCKPGVAGGDCNVKCESLKTDDITLASRCAHLIFSRMGFPAWEGWKAKCQGALPDLSECFDNRCNQSW